MAKKMREVLWKHRADTATDISELQLREEISDWLDEQSELTASYYAKDPATVVHFLEQETCNHGLSIKTR